MLFEGHFGLFGRAVGLPLVARDARQDAVLPGRHASLRPRHHMVDGQFFATRLQSAVLARVAVSLVNVAAAERDRTGRHARIANQGDHFRNADAAADRRDKQLPVTRRKLRPVEPAVKLIIFGIDDAILIPTVVSLVSTAINAATKSGQFPTPPADKGFDIGSLVPIIVPIVQALTKGQQVMPAPVAEKGFDPSTLVPVVVQVIQALTKGR